MAGVPKPLEQTDLDRRMVPRNEVSLGVKLHRVGEEAVIPAAIANLSPTGFLAELAVNAVTPEFLDVDLPNAGRRRAQVVWRSGAMAGCNFTVPLSRADMSAARLKSEFREASGQDSAETPPMFELGPSDPIWDMMNETPPHEKWPLSARVALIGAVTIAPWVPLVGLALVLA